jgi:hypothetical protein
VLNDPAIEARAAKILMLLAPDAADSLGSEGSCSLEEEVEQPQQLAAAATAGGDGSTPGGAAGAAAAAWPQQARHRQAGAAPAAVITPPAAASAAGGVAAPGPQQQQQPGLSPLQPSAQSGGGDPEFLDSDEFDCLLGFLNATSDAAAAPDADAAMPDAGMHNISGGGAPVAAPPAVQQPRQAGREQLFKPAAGSTHWGNPAAGGCSHCLGSSTIHAAAQPAAFSRVFGSSSSHADVLRAVSGAQHCIVDLRVAVLLHPDPVGCVAAFAASSQQRAHSSTAQLEARPLQHLAVALQVFRPCSALDACTFVLSVLGQLQQALSGLQVMMAVCGRGVPFDMRAVLSQWAAAVPASCSGADAAVAAAVVHLVQHL